MKKLIKIKKANLILVLLISLGSITYAQTISIGSQVWMTMNLDVTTFRNGDTIPEVKTAEEWYLSGKYNIPAWCYYENDPANGAKYGKLYNFAAVIDSRCLAPVGYHIPSDLEWTILKDYLGESNAATKMKSKSEWQENGNGSNSSGFSGLPGGYRHGAGGFFNIGELGYWWSNTVKQKSSVNQQTYTVCFYRKLSSDDSYFNSEYNYQGVGLSVRCISGNSELDSLLLDSYMNNK
jgi:uncharacterized protein (TIGR02145 family)